jgi:hypothetical protein
LNSARTTLPSTHWISNVNHHPRAQNNAAFQCNAELARFSQILFRQKRPFTDAVRLTLAVTTNGLDVLFDDAVLGDSSMVLNVFILLIATGVVGLPSHNSNGVTCFLGRA